MSEKRTRRAAEVFHSELARLIREEVKDPRLTRLSITHVKVAEGIRHATVFVTPLGGEGDGKEDDAQNAPAAKGQGRRDNVSGKSGKATRKTIRASDARPASKKTSSGAGKNVKGGLRERRR